MAGGGGRSQQEVRAFVYPTCTRDGRSVCGLAWEENRIQCYSFATRRFETLAEIGDNPLLASGWLVVPWFGLDADDNPLVVFDRSTRDLYALDWETLVSSPVMRWARALDIHDRRTAPLTGVLGVIAQAPEW